MGFKLKNSNQNSSLKAEYRRKTLGHNSKKLVILMGFIVLSQIFLSAIELIGIKELLYENIYARAVTIFFLLIFITVLTSIRKASEKAQKTQWLAFAKVSIQLLIIAVGIYLCVYMYSKEIDFYYLSNNNQSVTLKPNETVFSINMVSPNYNFPDKINYEYRIEPLSSNWINNGGNGNFIFNNLPSGRFMLYFRGKKHLGREKSETNYPSDN